MENRWLNKSKHLNKFKYNYNNKVNLQKDPLKKE